jgi:hypothetical protein
MATRGSAGATSSVPRPTRTIGSLQAFGPTTRRAVLGNTSSTNSSTSGTAGGGSSTLSCGWTRPAARRTTPLPANGSDLKPDWICRKPAVGVAGETADGAHYTYRPRARARPTTESPAVAGLSALRPSVPKLSALPCRSPLSNPSSGADRRTLDQGDQVALCRSRPGHVGSDVQRCAGAIYDASTRWPPGFDPSAHGAKEEHLRGEARAFESLGRSLVADGLPYTYCSSVRLDGRQLRLL